MLINHRWHLYVTLLNMKPRSPTISTVYIDKMIGEMEAMPKHHVNLYSDNLNHVM